MDNRAKAEVIDLSLRLVVTVIMVAAIATMFAFPPFAVVLLVFLL